MEGWCTNILNKYELSCNQFYKSPSLFFFLYNCAISLKSIPPVLFPFYWAEYKSAVKGKTGLLIHAFLSAAGHREWQKGVEIKQNCWVSLITEIESTQLRMAKLQIGESIWN